MDEAENFNKVLQNLRANAEETLDLSWHGFELEEVQRLAEALQGNSSVRTLDLSGAFQRDGDRVTLKALSPAFQTCAVTDLDLSSNRIDADGISFLVASLRGSSVRRLLLGWNELGVKGATALANALRDMPLAELSLESNQIGDAGVQALARALSASSITQLTLSRNNVWDAGVELLAVALKESKLKCLGLQRTYIGDDGVVALSAGLCGSSITDLDLSGNSYGDRGAKALAAALRESKLEKLLLSYNRHTGEESFTAFVQGARDSAVASLDFDFNEFEEDDVETEFLKQIKEVLEANKARTFLLQLQVEGDEDEWIFTFRTLAGTVAAVLNYCSDRPAEDLPQAAFDAMGTSGFQLPDRHLRAHNLRLLRPDGQVLDCSTSADLAQQLAGQKKRRLA